MKPSPKLQNLDHRSQCEQIHLAPDTEGRSDGEALQNISSPGAYGQSCSHEELKMQGNLLGDSRQHVVEPRVHRQKEIRRPARSNPAK